MGGSLGETESKLQAKEADDPHLLSSSRVLNTIVTVHPPEITSLSGGYDSEIVTGPKSWSRFQGSSRGGGA